MKQLVQEMKDLLSQKIYTVALIITALCGYGFSVTHYSIGIDDTAVSLYLVDGLEVEMGRWVMYLLNKGFFIGEFAPFVTELLAVVFLMLAGTVFCVLFKRILGERMGVVPCTLFSCVFVSNPLIATVFVYYFHNGAGLAYLITALALLCYNTFLEKEGKERYKSLLYSALFVWVAAGCYESFLVLYILGVLAIVFLRGLYDKNKLSSGFVIKSLLCGALAVVGSMILRTIMLAIVIALFQIDAPDTVLGLRSISEMSVLFSAEGLQNTWMLVKRFWLLYHVNALVFLPITGYELACFVAGIYAVIALVKKKNLWYPLLFGGMLLVPLLLTIIEAKVTFYRSCQYLPFFTAFGVLLLFLGFEQQRFAKYYRVLITFVGIVLIYNQATQLNRNFYTDYRQYELAKETMLGVAYDVERQFGTETPIVLVGSDDIPYEFIKHYYVPYDSWQYKAIAAITNPVDEHLKEKYFQAEGYCFIGELNLPMIRWGFDAFDGTNRELIRFLEMHGYSFTTITDKAILDEARKLGNEMPAWPREGSITMQDGYVLIHL